MAQKVELQDTVGKIRARFTILFFATVAYCLIAAVLVAVVSNWLMIPGFIGLAWLLREWIKLGRAWIHYAFD